jgi:3',5'-nucleoside bisphosphate phosphatase
MVTNGKNSFAVLMGIFYGVVSTAVYYLFMPGVNMKYIDLHIHTTISDGTFTPSRVVREAAGKNLAAIALTDHDSVGGFEEAFTEACAFGIELVPGIEITTNFTGELHILGYYINLNSNEFKSFIHRMRNTCFREMFKLFSGLNKAGIEISPEEVKELNGTIDIHGIIKTLVAKKYTGTYHEAFNLIFVRENAFYHQDERLSPMESIRMIKKCNGIAVLAHPGRLKLQENILANLVTELTGYGLDGIEALHAGHSEKEQAEFVKLAYRNNLIVTGGSDFHGINKPEIELGQVAQNRMGIPYQILEDIRCCNSVNCK